MLICAEGSVPAVHHCAEGTYMAIVDQVIPRLVIITLSIHNVEPLSRKRVGKNQWHDKRSNADSRNIVIVGDREMLKRMQGHHVVILGPTAHAPDRHPD